MDTTPIGPNGMTPIGGPAGTPAPSGTAATPGFKDTLLAYLKDVEGLQQEADHAVRDLVVGKSDNLHEVIAALSEADLSFRLMMQVRNRLVDAYREIMRMQV